MNSNVEQNSTDESVGVMVSVAVGNFGYVPNGGRAGHFEEKTQLGILRRLREFTGGTEIVNTILDVSDVYMALDDGLKNALVQTCMDGHTKRDRFIHLWRRRGDLQCHRNGRYVWVAGCLGLTV